MIIECFESGPAQTNGYLIGCEHAKEGAFVDAPLGASKPRIRRAKELELNVKKLLLTHSHWDHTAEAAQLKKQGLAIYVHREDAENLRDPGSDGLPLLFDVAAVEPEHYLEDGEQLQLGNLEIRVMHTPGHSPGGVCFYFPSEGVLISGDTLFKSTIGNLSFPTSNPDQMWKSLEKLSQLPKETRVFPGHGPETTIGLESWLKNAKKKFS